MLQWLTREAMATSPSERYVKTHHLEALYHKEAIFYSLCMCNCASTYITPNVYASYTILIGL